jgi:hypothetical protein
MRQIETALRLRIFLGEDDKYKGHAPHDACGAGAASGHGRSHRFSRLYRHASGVHAGCAVIHRDPGSEDKANAFPGLDQLRAGGVVTMEKVEMRRLSRNPKAG